MSIRLDNILKQLPMQEIYQLYRESTGVSIDTRTLNAGEMFFALKGPSFDGNKYVDKAIELGARWAISDDHALADREQVVLVDDVLLTLQALASYHRKQMDIPVIGLTGSNGKTTTKELLKGILSKKYKTSATAGNYNNHIGVPLTLLRTPLDTEVLIVEMGTNQPGDIRPLCEIAQPTLGLITNIGASHLEKLGNEEGVFIEKGELYKHVLEKGGTFFKNIGDTYLKTIEGGHLIDYRASNIPDVSLKLAPQDGQYLSIIIKSRETEYHMDTHLAGTYNLENIAAAMSIGHYMQISVEKMVQAISAYVPANMRSQVFATDRNTLILDAYNANPSSMKVSIEHHIKSYGQEAYMILGDMLELGEVSERYHQEMIDLLIENECENVLLVGSTFMSLDCRYQSFIDVSELIEAVDFSEINDEFILIKGSRGLKLEQVVAYL